MFPAGGDEWGGKPDFSGEPGVANELGVRFEICGRTLDLRRSTEGEHANSLETGLDRVNLDRRDAGRRGTGLTRRADISAAHLDRAIGLVLAEIRQASGRGFVHVFVVRGSTAQEKAGQGKRGEDI